MEVLLRYRGRPIGAADWPDIVARTSALMRLMLTSPVFEAELTAPITDDKGQPIRLGSVVSGGRYDGLVERFTGEKVPATGISIGFSRLLFVLQPLGKYKERAQQGPVLAPETRAAHERLADEPVLAVAWHRRPAMGVRAGGRPRHPRRRSPPPRRTRATVCG